MPKSKGPSPTARSLAHLRKHGYVCQVVEQTIPRTFIKRDLFGFIDILAIKDGETLAVQTTGNHGGDVARRIAKIRASENFPRVLAAGWRIEVHGWRRPCASRPKWSLRIEPMNLEETEEI